MGTQTDTTVHDASTNGSGGIHEGDPEPERRARTDDVVVGIPTYNEEIAIGSVSDQVEGIPSGENHMTWRGGRPNNAL